MVSPQILGCGWDVYEQVQIVAPELRSAVSVPVLIVFWSMPVMPVSCGARSHLPSL